MVEEETVESEAVDPVEEILANKMRSIIIPRIDFENVTVEMAMDYLRFRAAGLETEEPDPTKRGFSMVIRSPRSSEAPDVSNQTDDDLLGNDIASSGITELRLKNVPFATALRYICIMTCLQCGVDESRLTISPKAPNTAWNDVGSLLGEKGDSSVISTKIGQITIPRVDFENTSIYEAVDYLRLKSAEIENPRAINYVVHVPNGMTIPDIDKLQLQDATIEEILKQICAKTGMRYEVEEYAVVLIPKDLK